MAKRKRKRAPKPTKALLAALAYRKRRTAKRKGVILKPRKVDNAYLMRYHYKKGRKWLLKVRGLPPYRTRESRAKAILSFEKKHNVEFQKNSIQTFKHCFKDDKDALFQIVCIEAFG